LLFDPTLSPLWGPVSWRHETRDKRAGDEPVSFMRYVQTWDG